MYTAPLQYAPNIVALAKGTWMCVCVMSICTIVIVIVLYLTLVLPLAHSNSTIDNDVNLLHGEGGQ